MHNVQDISQMIYHLSRMIELGMGKGKKFDTFEKELKNIEHYCYIMKVRFGSNIEFRHSISEEAKAVMVPVLLLQPMVKNAITHGISQVNRKGIILIKAVVENGEMIVTVLDNGIGITADALEKMNRQIETNIENIPDVEPKSGIGILNTNERIKLNYGEKYNLRIESEYGHYFKIICRIPTDVNISNLRKR